MAIHAPTLRRRQALLLCCATLVGGALAQADTPTQSVTVTGARGPTPTALAGFGDQPSARAPFALSALSEQSMKDLGARTPADLVRWDASVGDAYNAPGYWSQYTVRGFVLDPRFNMRRDGLPISGETLLALDNKQGLQVLKGTSGIQAGTSAPGGLVNLIVKRPAGRVRSAHIAWQDEASQLAHVDVGDTAGAIGWRINAAAEALRPAQDGARGRRHLLAAALDLDAGAAGRFEIEAEVGHQAQPSVPGFSLLGDRIPDAHDVDPRRNLNQQPWSLPVVSDGRTASLRWTRQLAHGWSLRVHGAVQRLRTDDRIAFPFGCSADGRFDRYCTDGSFDLYDFRSDGERRASDALELQLRWAGQAWDASAGVLTTRQRLRTQRQAFNYVGSGHVDGGAVTPADGTPTTENTERDERSVEVFARARARLGADTELWAGLRSSHLDRASRLTDGSQATAYRQQVATPWLALSHRLGPALVYASFGHGAESAVVPNLPGVFANPGQVLPVLRSRQVEAGWKWRVGEHEASAVVFDTCRPATSDILGLRQLDGHARHRGIELGWDARQAAWAWHASAMALSARRHATADASLDGKRPPNVPSLSLRGMASYTLPAWPGLTLQAALSHDGSRAVLPDNSATIGGWTRIDVGARLATQAAGRAVTLRLGIDNLLDRRAWKEAPFQFGHAYLFPLAPRTLRLSAQLAL
ncbi:MAG: TonB-dependent siderophore receptor [Aquabacterium sp.]